MNKQKLAQYIWASANQMRGTIAANTYKDYILAFIFYKYLSDYEISFLKANGYDDAMIADEVNEADTSLVQFVQNNIGYFIAHEHLYATWLAMRNDFDVSNVSDALAAFNRLISPTHTKVFEKIFDTLQSGLSNFGNSSGAQTKAIRSLLALIKDIPTDGRQGYDVLGFIYEYLIGMFASNAGKKAGEFYTPHEVSLLMSEIIARHLQERNTIQIYDPTSGSGSLLINIGRSASKYMSPNAIKYYAQELEKSTYDLTRMNLVMRGISPANIEVRNADTLEEDWPNDPAKPYEPLYVDAVVSNPPYSKAWDPSDKEHDPRYVRFGLAPRGKADYAFLLHDLYHLRPDGIMTIVLPHGVLFRGGEEGTIRKNLIEENHIDAIIGLPPNIFFGTGIPTIIMVLRQQRPHTDVLIIDAAKGFVKEGKNNRLRASDIKRIVDVIARRADVARFARVVSRDEIRANEYNLNIPRYVNSAEPAEQWDVYACMFGGIPRTELSAMEPYWRTLPTLKSALFHDADASYVRLAVDHVRDAIECHADVRAFAQSIHAALSSYPAVLRSVLMEGMAQVDIARAEAQLGDALFACLAGAPLIDPYAAYQMLDEAWEHIAVDLEMIQTEGFSVVREVDMEEQDGRIIPFALVQRTLLRTEVDALQAMREELAEIPNAYADILENMSADEREECAEILSEEGDAFLSKEVTRKEKELHKDKRLAFGALCRIVDNVSAVMKREKKLKKEIREAEAALTAKTKECIAQLSDEEARDLLEKKWIVPLVEDLQSLPATVIKEAVHRIEVLQNKYAVTFSAIEEEIRETETALAQMVDLLEGSTYDRHGLDAFKALLMGEQNG